jgi:two-component system LytT family response regulator
MISLHKPELVLTDIMLYGRSAFDIFATAEAHSYQLVFITAFRDFAVPALRLSAVDYLLKPVSPSEFANTIDRVRKRRAAAPEPVKKRRLVISDHKEIHILQQDEIVFVQGEGSYSMVKLVSGKEIMSSRRLSEIEEMIGSGDFFRVHKSSLVNLKYIRKYVKGRGGEVLMSDGTVIYVSSRRKDEFLHVLLK